jgi:hypothetical protein
MEAMRGEYAFGQLLVREQNYQTKGFLGKISVQTLQCW